MMGLKNDHWIKEMALKHRMIDPFVDRQVQRDTISYGLSSYGYDFRIGKDFKVFTNIYNSIVDPKNFSLSSFVEMHRDDYCMIPPNSFVLARSVEWFIIPRKVLTICIGKSTYARCGIVFNVTPLEPEWEGYITIEISNTTPLPAKVYVNEGVAQILFFEADEECIISYADKKGKYQKQTDIWLPKVS